jgi:two-component system, sensor histidine kinase RegB
MTGHILPRQPPIGAAVSADVLVRRSAPARDVDEALPVAGHAPGGPRPDAEVRLRLAELARLRTIALAGQVLAIAGAAAFGIRLQFVPMLLALAVLAALNLLTLRRLARPAPIAASALPLQLAVDLAAFSVLVACAGGAQNPFVLLYLLHVVVTALTLPARAAAVGTLAIVAAASVVALLALPLVQHDGSPLPPAIRIAGWAASFALTAAFIAWFTVRLTQALAAHARALAEAQLASANDAAVLRVGTLAAGAAHELSSPLATMAIVVGEMRRSGAARADAIRGEASAMSAGDNGARPAAEYERDLAILAAQIDACRTTLSNLLSAAGHARAEGGGSETLDRLVESVVARVRAARPRARLSVDVGGVGPAPEIFADAALKQALGNLVDNAADVSPDDVRIDARWDDGALDLVVRDRGPGIPPDVLPRLGRAFFTTKPPGRGTGLGLVLTTAVLTRLGGSVRWANRDGGGAEAFVRLPLASLTLPPRNP